jgi:hypothetical protein
MVVCRGGHGWRSDVGHILKDEDASTKAHTWIGSIIATIVRVGYGDSYVGRGHLG